MESFDKWCNNSAEFSDTCVETSKSYRTICKWKSFSFAPSPSATIDVTIWLPGLWAIFFLDPDVKPNKGHVLFTTTQLYDGKQAAMKLQGEVEDKSSNKFFSTWQGKPRGFRAFTVYPKSVLTFADTNH